MVYNDVRSGHVRRGLSEAAAMYLRLQSEWWKLGGGGSSVTGFSCPVTLSRAICAPFVRFHFIRLFWNHTFTCSAYAQHHTFVNCCMDNVQDKPAQNRPCSYGGGRRGRAPLFSVPTQNYLVPLKLSWLAGWLYSWNTLIYRRAYSTHIAYFDAIKFFTAPVR